MYGKGQDIALKYCLWDKWFLKRIILPVYALKILNDIYLNEKWLLILKQPIAMVTVGSKVKHAGKTKLYLWFSLFKYI
jgi:hypothetical protein